MSDEAPGHPAPDPSGETGQRERSLRTNLLMSATIEAEDINAAVRIRNLSETGALLEGATLPKVGARLVLRRLQLEIGGTVIWSANARCGVAFEGTISVAGWRSGNWIAPIGGAADQARVDGIQAAVRTGSLIVEPSKSRPEWISDQVDADIDARIADELAALRDMLENLGEQLSEEAVVVQRYPKALQSFDLACQILGHLDHVLTAKNRSQAVDAIGMEELRHRLRRRPTGAR